MSRLGDAVHVLLHGLPPRRRPVAAAGGCVRQVVTLPDSNPMQTDAGGELRAAAAMSLMDDDTFGFLLFRVVQQPRRPVGEVTVIGYVDPHSWPAMRTTLDRAALVGAERVG